MKVYYFERLQVVCDPQEVETSQYAVLVNLKKGDIENNTGRSF